MRFPRMANFFVGRTEFTKMDKMKSQKSNGTDFEDSVHSVEKPLPNSRKVYVDGALHANVRVPFREITLAPTKSMDGQMEVNEPVRVYDTSGPWGDSSIILDVTHGLSALRASWIRDRGDVEEVEGRAVKPIDDGYLSDAHARHASASPDGTNGTSSFATRKPLRATPGTCVTQLAYARRGIVTPEMEYIAIREDLGREAHKQIRSKSASPKSDIRSPSPHPGESFGATHPARNHPGVCSRAKSREDEPSFRPTSIIRNRSR